MYLQHIKSIKLNKFNFVIGFDKNKENANILYSNEKKHIIFEINYLNHINALNLLLTNLSSSKYNNYQEIEELSRAIVLNIWEKAHFSSNEKLKNDFFTNMEGPLNIYLEFCRKQVYLNLREGKNVYTILKLDPNNYLDFLEEFISDFQLNEEVTEGLLELTIPNLEDYFSSLQEKKIVLLYDEIISLIGKIDDLGKNPKKISKIFNKIMLGLGGNFIEELIEENKLVKKIKNNKLVKFITRKKKF